MEEWRPVVSFERYQISNLGNVRRNNKLLTPSLDSYGYRQINLYKDSKRYTRKVYRLVLETFNPNCDNKPQIDHINRIKTDDRLENLRWVTAGENCRNKYSYSEELHGITWNKKNSMYIVRFIKDGREQYFGSCYTLDDAKKLRDQSKQSLTFVPQKFREMYCITKSGSKYRVRVGKNPSFYTNTLEDAKEIRTKLLTPNLDNN